jgi:2-phosphosulfolactate phosphatase
LQAVHDIANLDQNMNIEVVLLPAHLDEQKLPGKTAVVIDVLRATTTITSALAAGVKRIRAFGTFAEAQNAAAKLSPRPLLCAEVSSLPPPGADLGNSPRQWRPEHASREVFLSTTNGTKAIIASRQARQILIAALVNRAAVCDAIRKAGNDVVIVCSGSDGAVSLEDSVCAGAICHLLAAEKVADAGLIAQELFLRNERKLPTLLRTGRGGKNVIKAGLEPDIDFAAKLDALANVGIVDPQTLCITDLNAHAR